VTKALSKGERVPLTLEFETTDAQRISVDIGAEVVSANAKSALDHHEH
jgi:copper(I)-binding protein